MRASLVRDARSAQGFLGFDETWQARAATLRDARHERLRKKEFGGENAEAKREEHHHEDAALHSVPASQSMDSRERTHGHELRVKIISQKLLFEMEYVRDRQLVLQEHSSTDFDERVLEACRLSFECWARASDRSNG